MAPALFHLFSREACNPLVDDAGCVPSALPGTNVSNDLPASVSGTSPDFASSTLTSNLNPSTQPSATSTYTTSTSRTENLPIFAIIIIIASIFIVVVSLTMLCMRARKQRRRDSARNTLNAYETQKMRDFRMDFGRSPSPNGESSFDSVRAPDVAVVKGPPNSTSPGHGRGTGNRDLDGPLPPPPPPYSAGIQGGTASVF